MAATTATSSSSTQKEQQTAELDKVVSVVLVNSSLLALHSMCGPPKN